MNPLHRFTFVAALAIVSSIGAGATWAAPPDAATPPKRRVFWEPTVVTPSCTLRGSVGLIDAAIYPSPAAKGPVAWTTSAFRMDVSSLELPSEAAPRYAVTFDEPVQVKGWLDPSIVALALTEPLAIVADHAWLPAGTRASARRVGADKAKVTAAVPSALVLLEGASASSVDAARTTASTTVSCSALQLAGDFTHWRAVRGAPAKGIGERTVRVAGVNEALVDLFADATTTKPMARLRAGAGVTVLEERDGRARIALDSSDLKIDAWLDAAVLTAAPPSAMGGGIVGGVVGSKSPSFRAIEGTTLDVRTHPALSAPVVMRVAPKTRVNGVRGDGPFTAVDIYGVRPPTGTTYYVESAKLTPASDF